MFAVLKRRRRLFRAFLFVCCASCELKCTRYLKKNGPFWVVFLLSRNTFHSSSSRCITGCMDGRLLLYCACILRLHGFLVAFWYEPLFAWGELLLVSPVSLERTYEFCSCYTSFMLYTPPATLLPPPCCLMVPTVYFCFLSHLCGLRNSMTFVVWHQRKKKIKFMPLPGEYETAKNKSQARLNNASPSLVSRGGIGSAGKN